MDAFDEWWESGGSDNPTQPMTEEQKWKIHELLDEVTMTQRELDGIKIWFSNGPTFQDANELIYKLIDRLPNPVTERGRYSQRQVTQHIKNIANND